MKNPILPKLIVLFAFVLLPSMLLADELKVAITTSSAGDQRYIVARSKGGFAFSKSMDNKCIFTLEFLSGSEIKAGAQVRLRYSSSIWNRNGNHVDRTPARGIEIARTTFELQEVGGLYRFALPDGGWIGALLADSGNFPVVESESDAMLVEFILNPPGAAENN